MTTDVRNAIIKSVSIDTERALSAWMHLDYGGSGQGFGGYVLYQEPRDRELTWSDLCNFAGVFIQRCIEVGGVQRWEQLPGKTIRVRSTHSSVEAIGHIVKDDWFCPCDVFAEMRECVKKFNRKLTQGSASGAGDNAP